MRWRSLLALDARGGVREDGRPLAHRDRSCASSRLHCAASRCGEPPRRCSKRWKLSRVFFACATDRTGTFVTRHSKDVVSFESQSCRFHRALIVKKQSQPVRSTRPRPTGRARCHHEALHLEVAESAKPKPSAPFHLRERLGSPHAAEQRPPKFAARPSARTLHHVPKIADSPQSITNHPDQRSRH